MSLPPPRAADSLELLTEKYGVPVCTFRLPDLSHIRMLTKREARKYKRRVKRAKHSALRKRLGVLLFWLLFFGSIGAIVAGPDPSTMPWAKPVTPPTTQVILSKAP